ncbi:hypothetical protein I5Q82_16385 [Acutalibacter muris]|uniref:TnpV protein n=1 Tax=Acutalibacter muris TaxID=1796620 RepID=A0A1Z2XPH1_9FIRM|nr:hypothetical protein [Acutalibacter muris]ANU53023.1 hypothetical protein A4V00_02730 [Hungateiclostridiaceae bacterium KB18]ASB40301.1 hypothetical protein ADH66_06285 [Acutalibacter muris]QQR29593.1 hypothetical protein I5Q82_16385 [Acutalibacter muris]
MHITELQTPYIGRKIIVYGSGKNANRPVPHWREVQQVSGPLYKGREAVNKYGELKCDLYLLYDEVPVGLRYIKNQHIDDRVTTEYLLGLLQSENLASLSGYLDNLREDMENSRWVGLADIEFVKQFDEPLAQKLALHRQNRLELWEQARRRNEKEGQVKR